LKPLKIYYKIGYFGYVLYVYSLINTDRLTARSSSNEHVSLQNTKYIEVQELIKITYYL